MGPDSIGYHRKNALERADDHPGQALEYYGTRGETPLAWRGPTAEALGLVGEVTAEQYEALFAKGGARHPLTGEKLVNATRPGFEIVVSAHKTTALLGLLGRADDMHAILDAETNGTIDRLEAAMSATGGRRGKAAVVTQTTGLVYAVTRHHTTRAGEPGLHDHILIPNITGMLDAKGGWKALLAPMLYDQAEAAAMYGRLRAAAVAVQLGYPIEVDHGPSGRARDFRILGIPDEVCDIYSSRSDEIDAYMEERGLTGYRARNIAARATRAPKDPDATVEELIPKWIAALEAVGWTIERLAHALEAARRQCRGLLPPLTDQQIDALAARLLDPECDFLKRWKVFGRSRVIAEIAPLLYGHHPAELDHVIDHILRSELVVPLIGIPGAREQPYAAASVLATEQTIADTIARLIDRPGPTLDRSQVDDAIAAQQATVGHRLTAGQRQAIRAICGSGRAVEVIVGVAGSGKTTALDAASTALEDAGHTVIGTATSGQAARTLGHEAHMQSSTMRSLLWRLNHHQLTLTDRTVVIVDETGMTADADLARLLLAVERTGAKIVLVGDHRQLSAVGPGGALAAVLADHPHALTALTENLRQRDPAERAALAQLRDGSLDTAIGYYLTNDRVRFSPNRPEALGAMAEAWAADHSAGHDTVMMAWKRINVAALNRIARAHAQAAGWLTGPDLHAPGGRSYAVGDPVVFLAPNYEGELVTSQRGTVAHIDHDTQALTLLVDDGRYLTLTGQAIDAQHLDYGYAMTVHRHQGATCDRAHYYADGGGRELAYVALSRARHRTDVHIAADNIDQAIELIRDDWSHEQHQQWITHTARPGTEPRLQAPDPTETERARLTARLAQLEADMPPNLTRQALAARQQLDQLQVDRTDLTHGTGRWQHTPEGAVARHLAETERQLQQAEARAAEARLWQRPQANRDVRDLANALAQAEEQWAITTAPTLRRLDHQIDRAGKQVDQLEHAAQAHYQWLRDHPDTARAIHHTRQQLEAFDRPEPKTPDLARPVTGPADDITRARQQAAEQLARIDQRATQPEPDVGLGL